MLKWLGNSCPRMPTFLFILEIAPTVWRGPFFLLTVRKTKRAPQACQHTRLKQKTHTA